MASSIISMRYPYSMEIDLPALAKHFSGLSMPTRADLSPADPPYEGDFETVAQLLDPIEAQLIAGGLEASGIPTVIADNHLVQMHSLLTIAVGGVRIRVATARADEARAIIDAIQRGELALSDDDESNLV